jgi:hypothetical protein
MLTREALIKAHTKEVSIEGGSVIIRALTAAEAFELRGKDLQSAEIFGLIARSIVDPQLSAEDVGGLAVSVVTQLTTEIFTFNALGEKAVEDATAELKKTDALIMTSQGSWDVPQSK